MRNPISSHMLYSHAIIAIGRTILWRFMSQFQNQMYAHEYQLSTPMYSISLVNLDVVLGPLVASNSWHISMNFKALIL